MEHVQKTVQLLLLRKGRRIHRYLLRVNSSTRFENVLKLPDFQNEYAQGSYGVYNVKMLNEMGTQHFHQYKISRFAADYKKEIK